MYLPDLSQPSRYLRTCSAANDERGWRELQGSSAAYSSTMTSEGSADTKPDVRLSVPVVQALRGLGDAQKQSVAAAIRRIGPGVGKPLYINNRTLGPEGGRYRVVVPDGTDSPVVIFRELTSSEPGDFLVTALTDRQVFDDYERAERQGLLDNRAARALVDVAVGTASATRSYGEAALEGQPSRGQGAS